MKMSNDFYPLKFKSIFKEKVWGGRDLERLLGKSLPSQNNYGESWEISNYRNNINIVENGKFAGLSLDILLEEYKSKLVGEKVFAKYEKKFPLLIKYLDIHEKLSIQVHPNDEYALKHENAFGKEEAWYVIFADQNAKIVNGLNKNISKETFEENILNGNFSNVFNVVSVQKGDFITIKAGLVHGTIDGSMLVYEVQQNSDTTYRIYDFNRLSNGKLRPLHLASAIDVIDYQCNSKISTEKNRTTERMLNAKIQKLTRNKYFNIDKIEINENYTEPAHENFKIFSAVSGKGKLFSKSECYEISMGDTYFIPPSIDVKINGNVTVLKTLPGY